MNSLVSLTHNMHVTSWHSDATLCACACIYVGFNAYPASDAAWAWIQFEINCSLLRNTPVCERDRQTGGNIAKWNKAERCVKKVQCQAVYTPATEFLKQKYE
jgi:hypothetical protein